MDTLIRQSERLLALAKTGFIRDIYNQISWNARLIGIKGARGIGKTTLMLQRMKLAFPDASKALYVSLDDIWFASNSLKDLGEQAEARGITHLFIDEVHHMPHWERQIKNLYDFFPNINVVFTGSSLLRIDNSVGDLSRRCLLYDMQGLSFREYLEFEGLKLKRLTLDEVLYDHESIANEICTQTDILKSFDKYMRHGYYPFYVRETEVDYLIRVNNVVVSVIDSDIPALENVEYVTRQKAKHLLTIIASQTPSPINAKQTAGLLGVTVNQLIKILMMLDRAQILRLLYYKTERNPKSMAKPQKVLFDNPSIMMALGYPDKGKMRESFLASMLSVGHSVTYPRSGDLLVDNRYLFEVGGSGKGFSQIKDMPDSFVAAADIEFGFGNKIPLWMFGLLY